MKNLEVAIIGTGRFGTGVIEKLSTYKNINIIAIDTNEKILAKLTGVDSIYVGDASDEDFLTSQGLDSVDVFVVGIGENIQSSLLIASSIKTNFPKARIIAKSVSKQHEQILNQIGVTELVNPERSAARRASIKVISPIASQLSSMSEQIFEIDGGVALVKIVIPKAFHKLSLKDIDIPLGINVCLLYRNGEAFIPNGDTIFEPKDEAIIIGKTNDLLNIIQEFQIERVHDKTIEW